MELNDLGQTKLTTMQDLEQRFLPPAVQGEIDLTSLHPVNSLFNNRVKIVLLIIAMSCIAFIYSMSISLAYKSVSAPAFNATVELNFKTYDIVPILIENKVYISVVINRMIMIKNFNISTDCGDYQLQTTDSYYGYLYLNVSYIGCIFNVNMSYSMIEKQKGVYNIISLNGFRYDGVGDLTLITRGILDINGNIRELQTQPEIRYVTGYTGGTIVIATDENSFVSQSFDFIQIATFVLASQGVTWTCINIFVNFINRRFFKTITFGVITKKYNRYLIET